MIKETFLEIIKDIWPMLVIITVIITSLTILVQRLIVPSIYNLHIMLIPCRNISRC